jgi:hypothetical protein
MQLSIVPMAAALLDAVAHASCCLKIQSMQAQLPQLLQCTLHTQQPSCSASSRNTDLVRNSVNNTSLLSCCLLTLG